MEFAQPAITVADTRGDIQPEAKYALLQCFAFTPDFPQLIHLHTPEFSAVCPGTGLPDIGTLDVYYEPAGLAVELKSFKYYLFAYRDAAIFQEPVTDLIFGHLWRALAPAYLQVIMRYNVRGGFTTTVTVEKGQRTAG